MTQSPVPPADEEATGTDTDTAADTDAGTGAGAEGPAGERLAKVIARAGVCSRREAERLVEAGKVTLNGQVLSSPAVTVTPGDMILVNGQPLPDVQPARLWRYHKPVGLVTTHKDPQGRATVFEKLPDHLPRVISVGRLDLTSEGLLLLTNDGELARQLEHPSKGWLRRYRVRVNGRPDPERLIKLEQGVTVDGVSYGPIKARLERQQGANAWLSVSLREGKNREIRKVMEFLGMPVSRLIRVAYGPFQLGVLPSGDVEEVPGRVLREQLGRGQAEERPSGRARSRSGGAGGNTRPGGGNNSRPGGGSNSRPGGGSNSHPGNGGRPGGGSRSGSPGGARRPTKRQGD